MEEKVKELIKFCQEFACCDYIINRYGKEVCLWTPEGILVFDAFRKKIEEIFEIKIPNKKT